MSQQVPPWLQEQIRQYQQTQANLQAMMNQQKQMDMERITTERALEELRKAADGEAVYRQSGPVLIKTEKAQLVSSLEERLELAKTQTTVMEKQLARLQTTYREQEAKIQAALRGGASSPPQGK